MARKLRRGPACGLPIKPRRKRAPMKATALEQAWLKASTKERVAFLVYLERFLPVVFFADLARRRK